MSPASSDHSLYRMKLRFTQVPAILRETSGGTSYQIGSIGLSPLYSAETIDLHVRIATDLHQGFPWLHPRQA